MAAVLRISADPADIRAAFSAMLDEARKANRQLSGLETTRKREHDRTLNDEVRAAKRAAREKAEAEKKAAREKEKAERDAQKNIDSLQKASQRESNKLSQQKIRQALAEAKELERIAVRRLKTVAREEAKATRDSDREQERRLRSYEGWQKRQFDAQRREEARVSRGREAAGNRWGNRIGVLSGQSIGVGMGLHGEIQSAAERRAMAGHALTSVFKQAGYSASEGAAIRARFSSEAQRLGVPLEVLTQAAGRAQTEFSSFAPSPGVRGGAAREERSQNLSRFFAQVEEARDIIGPEGIGEYVRLGGLVRQIGGSDQAQSATMQGMARIAELGAIELSNVTKESMEPLIARVAEAQGRLGPGATAAQMSSAGHRALIQSMAELEVLRGSAGYSPRRAGNIMSAVEVALQNPNRQDRMLDNIRGYAGIDKNKRAEIEAALFEDDPTRRGQKRLKASVAAGPLEFISAIHSAGIDSGLMRNLFSAGGPQGQGLQTNWRNLLASLERRTANGKTGFEMVGAISREGMMPMSAEERSRRRGLEESDPMTRFVRQQEEHDRALAENSGELKKLSDRIAAWTAKNPVGGQVAGGILQGLVPAATGYVAGKGITGALKGGAALAASPAGQLAAKAAGGAGGMLARGLGALGPAAAPLGIILSAPQRSEANRRAYDEATGRRPFNAHDNAIENAFRPIGRWIMEAWRSSPPTVNISPESAAIIAARDTRSPADRNGSQ